MGVKNPSYSVGTVPTCHHTDEGDAAAPPGASPRPPRSRFSAARVPGGPARSARVFGPLAGPALQLLHPARPLGVGLGRRLADQHLVDDATKAIQVAAAIELSSGYLLGAHVGHRSDHFPG